MRNKKPVTPEPTPEQAAAEKHVEEMMNPRLAEPIDIFQGVQPAKIPLGGGPAVPASATSTAPTVPGKPLPKFDDAVPASKSLFTSVDALKRKEDDTASTPVTVSIKPKLTAPSTPIDIKKPTPALKPTLAPAKPLAPSPIVASPPKTVSLGGAPAAVAGTAVTVDRLARKEAFADAATDSAVADIVAKEGDDLLEAEDRARTREAAPKFKKPKRGEKLKKILTSKWLLLAIPLLLMVLAAVPYTRYKLASLVIKRDLVVTVTDSKTGNPVSGANVTYNDLSTKTNANGQAELIVPLGNGTLRISKGYYQVYSQVESLGFGDSTPAVKVNLVATGRQVPLTIINKLTKKPLAGVSVKVLGITSVSDKQGKLSLALPTKTASAQATLSADGYNTQTVDVQITDMEVSANSFAMVPSGALYFVANDDGKLDIVKTDLDGANRKVILAGTGSEDPATTSVFASRDWHYVIVRSKRDANQTSLYLIDTTSDKTTQFEQSTASYTPIGWSGHNFVYDVVRTGQAQYQTGRESLKSYNADQQQLNQLDQTQATGTSSIFAYQTFNNFFIIDTTVVYNAQWNVGGTSFDLSSQNNAIRSIGAGGSGKKDLQTYAAANLANFQAAHVAPATIDFGIYTSDGKSTFYSYNGGSVNPDSNVTAASFNNAYPVYLLSPDGNKTFWTDTKVGKPNLMLGDKNGGSPTTLSSGSEYTAYGWYTEKYLLYSRAGSGLYIAPFTGATSVSSPVKVSDYAQKVTAPASYGGGF